MTSNLTCDREDKLYSCTETMTPGRPNKSLIKSYCGTSLVKGTTSTYTYSSVMHQNTHIHFDMKQ